MTEMQLKGRSQWESNPSPRRQLNSTQSNMDVKCIGQQLMSTAGVEPSSTSRLEQLLHLQQQQQHLQRQQQQMRHEQHQLQQQMQRQMQNLQQHLQRQQQLQVQQLMQQEGQSEQQQLQRQMQPQIQQEQQHHQQLVNEQQQQIRQQSIQQDQHRQNSQQQQFDLNTSRQSSPGHSTCSTIASSFSTFSGSSTISTSSSSSPSDAGDSDRYKTELCRSYEENGTCRYGNKCLFAHGREELRLLERHPKYKTEFCRTYHTSGFCPYGQRCHFIHSCHNSPLKVSSPGLANRDGEGPWISSFGQLSMVLAANGREWNEGQRKFAEPERGFNEPEQRLNEPERRRIDMERKLAELELEQNTAEQERRRLELNQKSVEPDWQIVQSERRFVEAERKPLEMELSAILQRRRRQLRCGSVGSTSETPPPLMARLDSFTPSRTSSPMMLDETRSPSFVTSSPFTTYSNPVDIPYPGSIRYGPVSKSLKGSPGFPTSFLGSTVLPFTPPKDLGSIRTPPWILGDELASRSASRTSSPGLHQFVTISSAARQRGSFFLFDGDALAKLIQRS